MNKLTIIFFIIFLITFSCQNSEESSGAINEEGNTRITLSTQQMEMADIRWGQLEQVAMQTSLSTSASIDLPPQNVYAVHSLHQGYVKKVPQTLGDFVKKGQLLTSIKHPDLIGKQRQLIEKQIELNQLELDYERKKVLSQADAASQLSFEKVEAQFQLAEAQLTGIKAELKAIGINPRQVLETGKYQESIAILAPANGYVQEINIHPGQLVESNEMLYEILDLAHKHVEIEVLAKDVQKVKKGQKVRTSIPSTNIVFWSEIYRLAPSIDVEAKVARIHAHIAEGQDIEKELLPGTYLQTEIYLEEKMVWAIPNAALHFAGEKSYIFIKNGKGFKQFEVRTGMENGSNTEILNFEELKDQQIAVSGAYYLSAAMEQE